MIDKFLSPWPADSAYLFFVSVSDETVARQIAERQSRFDLAGLAPVLTDELHITVLPIAFEGAASDEQLMDIRDEARQAVKELSAEQITLGPVVVDDDQVVLLAKPCRELRRVQEIMFECVQRRLGNDAMPNELPFRPHVSMFYSDCEQPTGPVADIAAEINRGQGRDEIRLVIDGISLVKVARANSHYRNMVLDSFRFGKTARIIT
jgi:2'-5' RNA ligase